MKKILPILLLLTCFIPKVKAQDSITFIPVFYKQCNHKLIKADSVNFRLSYNDYSYLMPDSNDATYNKPIGIFYASKTESVVFEKVPEYIRLPKAAENISLFTNTHAELTMELDENNIWRDTFYIENSERYFRPPFAIQTECGEISHGMITRYELTGEVSEIDEYNQGVLISKTLYHEGIKVYEGKNLNTFDTGYSLIRYNTEGDTIFYQDYQYSALYSYDGKLMAEVFHPIQTKKQIRRYRKKVNHSIYSSIMYEGMVTENTYEVYQPCIGKVYFPSGKIKLEGEYLVTIGRIKDEFSPFVELLNIDDTRFWFNTIPLWVKEYDETGRYIYRDIK